MNLNFLKGIDTVSLFRTENGLIGVIYEHSHKPITHMGYRRVEIVCVCLCSHKLVCVCVFVLVAEPSRFFEPLGLSSEGW